MLEAGGYARTGATRQRRNPGARAEGGRVVLDTVTQVERFVDVFIAVYALVVFAYVLTSWVKLPYSLHSVQRFLDDVCGPYLRIWRRFLPSFGPMDFSPMVGLLALYVLDRTLRALLNLLH
jgi:YggT family protein